MLRPLLAVAALLVPVVAAHAGETPLHQPAPVWVNKAALDSTKTDADAPALLIFDNQQRIEAGRLWVYSDTATRIASAEMLGQFATITLQWMPDKGDLIIHDLVIMRAGQEINLMAGGKGFTVLRREQGLEQRQLSGLLSATMPVEGLQVGDILRLRYSVIVSDPALAGNIQNTSPLIPAPVRVGFGRVRVQWDAKSDVHWKILASDVAVKPTRSNGYTELLVPLPIAKQPDMPEDAPARFRHPPLLELSTFADWQAVSKIMSPLYATDGLIKDGSPLSQQLAEVKALATPMERAQRALQIVQDNIRYLALGMNGGNYVPQKPEDTWTLRYGDCKAKSLLLLALLRGAGIDAEAVLVNSQLGDLVHDRLPSAGAFDHVIVRAVINGESLWLDGTAMGARIEDIRDTPPFHYALPLRLAGAELMPLVQRKVARPSIDLTMEVDESASVDLPSAFSAKAILRGPAAAGLNMITTQLDRKQRDEFIAQFFARLIGSGQYSDVSLSTDQAAGTTTLSARGATTSLWSWQEKHMKRSLIRSLPDIDFNPDRAKSIWSTIAVATPDPDAIRYRLRLRLPNGGEGFTVEGEQNAVERVAGRELTRSMSIEKGIVTVDERLDTTGAEIAVADIPAERDRLSTAQIRLPRLVAPPDTRRRWELKGQDSAGATQVAAIETTFAQAISRADADDVSGYLARSSLRNGIGNRAGALDDLTKVISIAPDVDTYLKRANVLSDLGRLQEALADAEKARSLDPSSDQVNGTLSSILAETGKLDRARELLDQRIALGGDARDGYRQIKAGLIGEYGDPQEALSLLDGLLSDKPGSPALLNARCWVKATRSVMIDTALKDCTSAIELSTSAYQALDSRALVWFRLARYDEALQDLNAVLNAAPGIAQSRYLRGVILNRMGREKEAAMDLTIARQLEPRIDVQYGRFNIKP
jgi:tetratricopeptide (TPR) repeat protein